MDTERIKVRMAQNIMVNGGKASSMVRAKRHGPMAHRIKASFKKGKNMDTENFLGQIETFTKVNSCTTSYRVKDSSRGMTVVFTQATG